MTTLSVYRVGDPWMQWLNVHELGHQWWGDWVTMDDWRHIWLNEGFATHTEWLWAEHLGPEVFAQYLEDEDWRGWFSGPVFDNPSPFSWTIYAKGSWVAWMLRHVIGDEAFFDAMAAYRAANGGATGTTEDLENAMETASGMELDWFFDEWVYGRYRPRYVYDWSNGAGASMLELTVRQVQTNTGLFRMPMNIRVTTTAGDRGPPGVARSRGRTDRQHPARGRRHRGGAQPRHPRPVRDRPRRREPDLELGPRFPDGYDFGIVPGSADRDPGAPAHQHRRRRSRHRRASGRRTAVSFEIDDPPDFPLTIPPGETATVTILFDPAGIGRIDRHLLHPEQRPRPRRRRLGPGRRERFARRGRPAGGSRLGLRRHEPRSEEPPRPTSTPSISADNRWRSRPPSRARVSSSARRSRRSWRPAAPTRSSSVSTRPRSVAATGSVIFHQGDPTNPLEDRSALRHG